MGAKDSHGEIHYNGLKLVGYDVNWVLWFSPIIRKMVYKKPYQ